MDNQVQDLTDDQVTEIQAIAGGREDYKAMMRWCGNIKTEKFNDEFKDVTSTGDVESIKERVVSIKKMYDTAMAADPEGTIEASKDNDEPPHICKQVWQLMVGEGNYENNSLKDMVSVTDMCLYIIAREHEMTIDDIRESGKNPEMLETWESDLRKIHAAQELLKGV